MEPTTASLGILKLLQEPIFILMGLMIVSLVWVIHAQIKSAREVSKEFGDKMSESSREMRRLSENIATFTKTIEGLIQFGQMGRK